MSDAIGAESPAVRRPALIDAASASIRSILQYLLAFLASVVLSRALGPEGRGQYYLPVLAATALIALIKLGLDQANVYLAGSRAVALGRLSEQSGFVAAMMGVGGAAALVALPAVLPGIMGDVPAVFLLLAALTIPFTLHSQYSAVILTLAGRPAWQYRAGITSNLVNLTLLLVLIALGRASVGLALGTGLVAAIVNWVVMIRPLPSLGGSWLRYDRELLRRTLRYSLVLHVAMVLLFLHLRVGMFMVKQFLGVAPLGHFSLAVILAEAMWLLTDAVTLVIVPRQVGTSLNDAAARSLQASRGSVVLGTVATAVLAAAGWPLIQWIFGGDFLPAYPPLLALLPGIVALGVQRACSVPTLRAGLPWSYSAIYAAAVLVNVVLNLWWIPRFGLVGAGAAWSVSCFLSASLFLTWTARLAGGRFTDGLTPTAADWQAIAAAVRHVSLRRRKGSDLPA